jgi:hypothetical protein
MNLFRILCRVADYHSTSGVIETALNISLNKRDSVEAPLGFQLAFTPPLYIFLAENC